MKAPIGGAMTMATAVATGGISGPMVAPLAPAGPPPASPTVKPGLASHGTGATAQSFSLSPVAIPLAVDGPAPLSPGTMTPFGGKASANGRDSHPRNRGWSAASGYRAPQSVSFLPSGWSTRIPAGDMATVARVRLNALEASARALIPNDPGLIARLDP